MRMREDESFAGFRTGVFLYWICAAKNLNTNMIASPLGADHTILSTAESRAFHARNFISRGAADQRDCLNGFKARQGLVFIIKALDHVVEFSDFDERQHARLQVDDLQTALHRPQLANAEQNRAQTRTVGVFDMCEVEQEPGLAGVGEFDKFGFEIGRNAEIESLIFQSQNGDIILFFRLELHSRCS